MKKKVLFVVNPISGSGKYQKIVDTIKQSIDKEEFDYKIELTERQGHAAELSEKAVIENYDAVVASGGDGTMHEVAKKLIGTSTALGLLPNGSGNGLARNMNIPVKLPKAIEALKGFKTVKIDTGIINDEKFIGIAGIGFDAHIAWKFANHNKRGFQSYIKLSITEYANYFIPDYKIIIDGKEYFKKAFSITMANSSQFGNNAIIAPEGSIYDGLIDVCIVKEFPNYAFPETVIRLFTKTIDKSKYYEVIQGKDITIEQQKPYAHLDGEPVEIGKNLHISINPKSLNVIVPGFSKK